MRTTTPMKATGLLLTATLMIGLSASGATIYNNYVAGSDLNQNFAPTFKTNEFGDEIILEGPQRTLTNFTFAFFALNNGAVNPVGIGPIEARIQFYLNDGALFNGFATPGSRFYDSGFFSVLSLSPGGTIRSDAVFTAPFDFPGLGLAMGAVVSNFTWTVQFRGMDADDTAGLALFNPPAVGTSPAELNNHPLDDYWQFEAGSGWALKTNSVVMNFAARFEAIPEPSTVAIGLLGGFALLIAGGRLLKRRA